MKSNFNEEKKLWKKGYKFVIGLDEVGRGPLAGPVVAGAVILNSKFKIQNLKINDSKKLSVKRREELYEILTNHSDIFWGIGIVSEKVIDKINILEATKLAMQKAIDALEFKIQKLKCKITNQNSKLLIDGNFSLKTNILQKSIIKGDEKVFSISAASIIAKVTRDKLMDKLHEKYPEYGFDKHKGYGTAMHLKNIKKFGPCKIHRKSFEPIKSIAKMEIV